MSSTGIATGLEKGYPVEKREKAVRPSNKKGTISKRTKMVRDLVSEVCGLSPYEKRLMDMLKTGGTSSEKRMYKYSKRRVSFINGALKNKTIIFLIFLFVRFFFFTSSYDTARNSQTCIEEERSNQRDIRQDPCSCSHELNVCLIFM